MIEIDGMKMPKNCKECEISHRHLVNCENYCNLTENFVNQFIDSRDPECPLRERKTGRWIEIPAEATNGDVLKLIYGISDDAIQKIGTNGGLKEPYESRIDAQHIFVRARENWWNAPYEGSEEQCNSLL